MNHPFYLIRDITTINSCTNQWKNDVNILNWKKMKAVHAVNKMTALSFRTSGVDEHECEHS